MKTTSNPYGLMKLYLIDETTWCVSRTWIKCLHGLKKLKRLSSLLCTDGKFCQDSVCMCALKKMCMGETISHDIT